MKTILLVDDEPLFLSSLADVLANCFDDVLLLTATNGMEATRHLSEEKIDLIITDLKMPVMDGFELLVHVLNQEQHIPVIVMTAFGTPEKEEQASAFGAVGWIEKPIDVQILSLTIKEVFARQEGLARQVRGNLFGISLADFLFILENEQKTCTVTVKINQKTGDLYFNGGVLVGADFDLLHGEQALREILSYEPNAISLENACRKKERTIHRSLSQILSGVPATDNGILPSSQSAVDVYELPFEEHQMKGFFDRMLQIGACVGTAIIERETGISIGSASRTKGFLTEATLQVVTPTMATMQQQMAEMGLASQFEDVLLVSKSQYQILRSLPRHADFFLFVAFQRERSNLGMLRVQLAEAEQLLYQ
ncbi:MAG: response regulator [Blastocatellia bacterium]|nr:response regulator [Blastocatellia bacterium]